MASEFDDLYRTLDNLGQVGKKVARKALNDGANQVKERVIINCPSERAKKAIKIGGFKSGKGWASIGVTMGGDWDLIKGAYFQNYGYYARGSETFVNKHVGWWTKGWEASRHEADKIIIAMLEKEIDSILG